MKNFLIICTVLICFIAVRCLQDDTPLDRLTSFIEEHSKSSNCSEDQFPCGDGTCIQESWRCDTLVDCNDTAADENFCENFTCNSGESPYQCKNGACIPSYWVCDGELDCPDDDDEDDCNSDEAISILDKVLNEGQVMNGTLTLNGSIEVNGTEIASMDKSTDITIISTFNETDGECGYECDDGQCIEEAWRCDTEEDCLSGEDEMNCQDHKCNDEQFSCGEGFCIPMAWKCDAERDCQDGGNNDEDSCEDHECLYETDVQCSSGHCIPYYRTCDMYQDCEKGEDEEGCMYDVDMF